MRSFNARVLSAVVLLTSMAAGIAPAAHAAGMAAGSAAAPAAAAAGSARGHDWPPQGAEQRALAAARHDRHAVAVPEETTPTQTVAANPNGTLTVTQSAAPVRKLASGTWKALDPTLHRSAAGRIAPAVTTAGVGLSGGGSGPLATLAAAGRTLAVSFPMALPAPALSGNTATYAGVLPGVDLVVTADAQGAVSDVLVVHDAAAAANPRLRQVELAVKAPGLRLAVGKAGDITLSGKGGHVVFAAPTPFMWDSRPAPAGTLSVIDPASGVAVDAHTGNPLASSVAGPGTGARNVPVRVAARDSRIVLTPDPAMLTSPKTIFPVFLDPSFNAPAAGSSRTAWATINNGFPGQSYWKTSSDLQVGYNGWESPFFTARSFFSLPVPSKVYGAHVISAQLNLHETWSPSCTAKLVKLVLTGAISSSTTWNHQPSPTTSNGTLQDTQTVAHGWSSSCAEAGVGFDVSNAMQSAANASWTQATFGLQAGDESDAYGWKKFNSTGELSVTYDHTPAKPAKLTTSPVTSCSGATVVGDGDVKLYVPVSDPDGGPLGVTLQMWKTGTSTAFKGTPTSPQSFFTSSGRTLTFVAHKADLEAASGGAVTEFSWKAEVTDFDLTSAWSATCNFKFDATRPAAPDIGDPSALSFTIGQQTGVPVNPTASGTVPASYQYQVDGGTPGTVTASPDGSAMIPVTPARFSNVLTVMGVSPAGNLSEEAVSDVFYAAPGAPESDGDMTGDGTADLMTAGGPGTPPGLWLASGRGDGNVVTQAADWGANGNGTQGDFSPADFTGAQVITGHFNGTQFQDALVYYPSGVASDPAETAGQANVLYGTGDGSANSGDDGLSEQTIKGAVFNDGWGEPLQLANAGDTQGAGFAWPDLIGISQGGTLVYMPDADGFGNYQNTIDLGNNSPDGSQDWTSWQIATAQVASGTAMYAWNPGTGALYLWTGLHYDAASGVITRNQYVIADGTSAHWNTGAGLTLHAADINGDGTADLWAVTPGGIVTAYLAAQGPGTAALAAQSPQTLLSSTHTWPLNDSQAIGDGAALPASAADTTGPTALPLGFTGNVQWNTGDLFDPDVTLGLNADGDPGGGTGSMGTSAAAVNPNSGGFTVSAWANPALLGGTVLSQDMSNTASFRLGSTSGGQWEFCLAKSNVASPAWDCATGGDARAGNWSQLTATYNPSTTVVNLYQGDVNVGIASHTAVTGQANGAFEVGAYHKGTARTAFFTGQVAQVQAWSRVIAPADISSPGGYFHPLPPTRITDTRSGGGLNPNANAGITVLGKGGVPATGVTAVAMTVTALDEASAGYLIVYPHLTPRPRTSDLSYVASASLASFKIVAPGPDGQVSFYNASTGFTDIIVDISGYFTADPAAPGATTFTPMTPTRIANTIDGTGVAKGQVSGGRTIAVQAGGVNGIPSGVSAVAINPASANSAGTGWLESYPDGTTRPAASGAQYHPDGTYAATVIVPVAANGKIDVFTSATTDIIVDVEGYFTPGTSGEKFHSIGAARLIDSRQHGGPVAAGGVLTVSPGAAVAAINPALAVNLTTIGGPATGYNTAYAHGTSRGTGSSLDYAASQTIANLALAPAGGGSIDIFNYNGGGATQIIVDCSGYFSLG